MFQTDRDYQESLANLSSGGFCET